MKLLLLCAALGAALSASVALAWPGAKPTVAKRKPPATVAARHFNSPADNKARAERKAEQLLHRFHLPAGAQALAHEPRGDGGLLGSPATATGGSELVDRHRLWKVPLPLAAAVRYVEHAHHPPRTSVSTADGPGVPPNRSVGFTYFPRNGRLASFGLEVTFVALPHGWTGIRADAQVVWIYPRTKAQMAPADTQLITVRSGSTIRRVTDHRTIERIISRFDRHKVVQPGVGYHCPAILFRGPRVTIDFHAADPAVTARAVARGTTVSTPCAPIAFTVHGRTTELVGGDFVRWLEGVLEVRFRSS